MAFRLAQPRPLGSGWLTHPPTACSPPAALSLVDRQSALDSTRVPRDWVCLVVFGWTAPRRREESRRGTLRACATGLDVATNGDTARKNACATKESDAFVWPESWFSTRCGEAATEGVALPIRDGAEERPRISTARSALRGSSLESVDSTGVRRDWVCFVVCRPLGTGTVVPRARQARVLAPHRGKKKPGSCRASRNLRKGRAAKAARVHRRSETGSSGFLVGGQRVAGSSILPTRRRPQSHRSPKGGQEIPKYPTRQSGRGQLVKGIRH